MEKSLKKEIAAAVFALIFLIQSGSLFAYSDAAFNQDVRELATTASEQSKNIVSASLSLYTGSVFSSDFISYAKSVGVDPGNADRWLTESRLISTFFNALSLYTSYEKGDSIGMTANSIKVLLNLNSFDALKVVKIPPPYGPIISLLLTGVKVTAESYQAVAQTGREVDIERLYFMLGQDKALRPEKGGLIAMNRENVDRVFNLFLMGGNAEFRTMINSYLVEKLGKSIPTEDMANRLNFNTGMVREAPETVVTVEEFYAQNKQEIETYIAALLKDLNLLLKAQFEETRLRQEIIGKKAELEKLNQYNQTYGGFVQSWAEMVKANSELIQKYEPIARSFNARLEDAKRKNAGTAAREVRDEAQYAIMAIEAKGFFAEDNRVDFLNGPLLGNKLVEILALLRPGFKQAAALAKALGEKEDAEEKKAYEEYVKNSQAVIQGFVSFKLEKYPLDAKLAEWKEAIDKYFRAGGTSKAEILEALGVDKTAVEVDAFYKKQWEEQLKALTEKQEEVNRLWGTVTSRWDKSEEYLSLVGTQPSDEVFKKAQEAFVKRRDEKYAEINKINEKLSAAWNLFCAELAQSSGYQPASNGTGYNNVLGGEGFYKFKSLITGRIDEWEKIRLLIAAEEAQIWGNAQPPQLIVDAQAWITGNDKIIASAQNWKIQESSFGKVPGMEGVDLREALQKLQDSLSETGGGGEDLENYFDHRFSVEAGTSYGFLKDRVQKVDERIKEVDQFIEAWTKACSQSDAAYSKWKMELKSGPDQTVETAKMLRDSFKKFKQVAPEALQNLERAYADLQTEAADRKAFIQSRIVLVKALLSQPLFMNFEQIKNEVKPGVPLKASYLYAGEKGYLGGAQVKALQGAMIAAFTAERMKALEAMAPKLHKQAEEARDFAAKIKFVGDKDVVGLDGSAVTVSEQQAQLNKAQTIAELNALGWERILAENGLEESADNSFAANYRKRLEELKEKEDEANKMVQKASMPVTIKSIKVNGKAFTGEVIEVDFAKDKTLKITGEIESGVKPREVTVSTEKTDFVKGSLGSSSERDGKVLTSFNYDLPIGTVAGTSGKVMIGSSAGGSNGYQEFMVKVSGASQENALAGLEAFLDEARQIRPEGDYRVKFSQIREKMLTYLKDSGLSPGSPEVVSRMNEVSSIESALSSTASPLQGPAGSPPPFEAPAIYRLLDARLNTFSLNNARGEVVVTNTDLRQGAIEITARLSQLDRVEKLLFSEDDGRTWSELPLNQSLSCRFFPIPDQRYQPVLRIRTVDGQEEILRFFPNLDALVHRNISSSDLVVAVVAKIANAYESQNLSAFASLISRDYLGNRVYLEEGVRFDFDMFADIRLKIFIDRVQQSKDLYVADTHWEKSQNPRTTGQQQMTTGRTTMMFSMEDGELKIKNLRGDLIYATLSPQIAESSGLSQTVVEEIRVAEEERNPIQPGAGDTVQSGGTSQNLPIQTGSVHSLAGPVNKGFAFATNTELEDPHAGDIHFESDGVATFVFEANAPAAIQEVTGAYAFDSLSNAPTIADEGHVFLSAGDVILLVTAQGYYCKIKITSVTVDGGGNTTAQFQFAVQTDGSRNLATQ